MTAVVSSIATELAAIAAATVASSLASGQPLIAGEPSTDASALEGAAHALLAEFTGTVTGELVLTVDDEVASALRESELGPLELVDALTPTLAAVAAALGSLTLGPVRELDARLAVNRALQFGDAALVPLTSADDQTLRAGVVIGVTASSEASDDRGVTAPSPERLDLLRGVEMDATAELGRARMTVNDLLSLRNGAVIELDRVAGAPADLYVNGRLIARGEVVVVDENYGLRITQVVTDESAAR